MFDTSHQGRADLVLAVPRGFGPINLLTTWLATDQKPGDIMGFVEKIDVIAKAITN